MVRVSGLLNLDKPAGMTSRRVVDRVERLARPAKVGHAGTLDPLATGVLVVCVGAATRLIEYVHEMPKQYTATFLLGRQSPTEDTEGEVAELPNPPVPTRDQLVAAAGALVGRITQRPPIYSALKVRGRRAYALARQGKQVDLKPRLVTVHRIDLGEYDYPKLTLNVQCGSGTYVRSLGRDLAESLGTSAVMASLVRSAVGGLRIEDAVRPEKLTRTNWTEHVLPPVRAVERLPRVRLTAAEIARVRNGQTVSRPSGAAESRAVAAVDADGRLVAILAPRGPRLLGPLRNLPAD